MKSLLIKLGYAPAILVPRAVSFLVVIVFTRLLAPEEFGLYALILVYGELLDAVFLNWCRLGLLRFYYRTSGVVGRGLIPGMVLLLAIGVVLGTGLAVLISLTSESSATSEFILLLILYLVSNGVMRFGLTILRAQDRRGLYVLLEVTRPLLGFALALGIICFYKPNYMVLGLGMFGATALFSIGMLTVIWRSFVWGDAEWRVFGDMMRYASPLLLVFLWANLINASDRFILNFIDGAEAVGLYAAAYSLARPLIEILFNIVNLDGFPRLVRAYEEGGMQSAHEVLQDKINVMMFLCIPMLTAIMLLAEPLSDLLLGGNYQEHAPAIMRLVALGGFFAGIKSFIFDQIFHLERKSMIQGWTMMPAALVNIVLNFMLIPTYGVIGAAWATLFCYVLAAGLSAHYSRRYLIIQWPVRDSLCVLFASAAMALVLAIVQWGHPPGRLLLSVPLAAAIFLFVCFKGSISALNAQGSKGLSKDIR